MTPTTPTLQVIAGDARREPSRGASWRRRAWMALGVAIVAGVALAVSWAGRPALDRIPAGERSAIYARTLDDLRQFCGEPSSAALKEHCRELALFASRFDECRGECEALVRRQLTSIPTR
jgi:hypothetical protein